MLVFCSDQPNKGILKSQYYILEQMLVLYSDQPNEGLLKSHYFKGEQMLEVVMVNPICRFLGFASIPKHM